MRSIFLFVIFLSILLATPRQLKADSGQPFLTEALQTKEVSPFYYFYNKSKISPEQISNRAKSAALSLGRILFKRSNAKVSGGFTFIFPNGPEPKAKNIDAELGFPISKKARKFGKAFFKKTSVFKCAFLVFKGKPEQITKVWEQLTQYSKEAGHKLSGERRAVILKPKEDENVTIELQLGIL